MSKLITKLKQLFCLHLSAKITAIGFGNKDYYYIRSCRRCEKDIIKKVRG